MASPRGYFQAKDVSLYYSAALPYSAHLDPEDRSPVWDGLRVTINTRPPQFSPWARLHGYGSTRRDLSGEFHHASIKRVRGVQSFSPFKKELNTVSFGEWGNQNRVQFVGVRQGSAVEFNFNLNFSDPIHRALRALPIGHIFRKGRNVPNNVPPDDFLMMYFNKRRDYQPSGRFNRERVVGGGKPIVIAENVGGLASEEALMIIKGEVVKNILTPPDSVEGSWFNVTIGVELSEDLVLRINPFQEVK